MSKEKVKVRVLPGQRVLLNTGEFVEAGDTHDVPRDVAEVLIDLKIVELVPAGKSAQGSGE